MLGATNNSFNPFELLKTKNKKNQTKKRKTRKYRKKWDLKNKNVRCRKTNDFKYAIWNR